MLLFYFILVDFLMLLKLWTEWKWDVRIVKLNLCIYILNKTIEKFWYYWLRNSLELDKYK